MNSPALPVIFRAERSGQVTAVLPTMAADYAGREFVTYAHIGQHGGATLPWYRETRAARPDEYADLLQELRGIYERSHAPGDPVFRLDVRRRFTAAHRAAWQADARAARERLRAEPAGGPWTPESVS
jgi:hypothetical protein